MLYLLSKDRRKGSALVSQVCPSGIQERDVSPVVRQGKRLSQESSKLFAVLFVLLWAKVVETGHKQCEGRISRPSEGNDGNRCNADSDVRLGFSKDAGRFLGKLKREGLGIRDDSVRFQLMP